MEKENKILYIYHIFGKKIGVTRDLKYRLTSKQGYLPSEYEVLESSTDIDYISKRELELQSIYGYTVDRQTYKNLIKLKQNEEAMNLNVTEQTTTFPFPMNKLKGNLMDNIGFGFQTQFGDYTLTSPMVQWIMENANTSMFNEQRTYVYNKALEQFTHPVKKPSNTDKMQKPLFQPLFQKPSTFHEIRSWAEARGIYKDGDSKTQYIKLQEESGELARAILKKDRKELIDAIGDMVVVLTNLAALEGLLIEDCIAEAYNVIKSRKGKMINGTFVKDAPQTQNGILKGVLSSHLNSTL